MYQWIKNQIQTMENFKMACFALKLALVVVFHWWGTATIDGATSSSFYPNPKLKDYLEHQICLYVMSCNIQLFPSLYRFTFQWNADNDFCYQWMEWSVESMVCILGCVSDLTGNNVWAYLSWGLFGPRRQVSNRGILNFQI